MKKVLSIVLAIAMIATMSAVAFAATDGSVAAESAAATGTATFDVNGVFAAAAHVDRFKVDVEWTNTDAFTYTEAATKWNTETHQWDETAAGSWAGSGSIKVDNHSSKAVTATASWAAADGGNVEMNFDKALELAACEENGTAPTGTITATIKSGSITADAAIGTITVTIAEKTAA